MSLTFKDTFSYSDQEKLLVEPIFRSDLIVGHFEALWQGFIGWFLDYLDNNTDWDEYKLLKKEMNKYLYFHSRSIYFSFEFFLERLNKISQSENEELKNEFFKIVWKMELSLNKDSTKWKARRILWMWNWVDFAQYKPWISWFSEDTFINEYLRFWLKSSEDEDNVTLWEELLQDIWIISNRVNKLLWKTAILNNGTIVDNSVWLFSALDWYVWWEVFLTIDWIIVNAKPPKWDWND